MKKLRFIFVFVLLLQISAAGFSQGRFGKDSAECVKYLGFYKDSYKQGNYAEAAPNWRAAMKYCPPASSHDMLFQGIRILKYYIENPSVTPQRKKELLDSIAMLYEMRKEYFPRYTVAAQINKTYDMEAYGADEKTVLAEVNKSIEVAGNDVDPGLLVVGLQKLINIYKQNPLGADDVMNFYSKGTPIFDAQIASTDEKTKNHALGAKADFENLFANSGVASCENIVALYTPTFEANKGDKDYVSRVVYLLEKANCNKEDLFLKAVESLNIMDPSARTSYYLYKLYLAKDDNKSAIKFLQEAVDNPKVTESEAADYLLEMSQVYLKLMNSPIKAVESAKLAAAKNPSLTGKAYMIIATVWAANKCGGNEIESRAHFWVAVDYLSKAKNADPSLADEADKLIASYRSYFPLQEEAFMFDVLDGNAYTVSCGGLRETTTVRTRK